MSAVRERVVRGVISGLMHEAFTVVLSFGAMLVLVRLLTPTDYGEAAAVAGVLALVRAFSGALCAEHALQHGKDTEPDWTTYFSIVGLVQVSLFAATNVIALVFRTSGFMAAVAPLLHVASIGLLLDWPAQIASVKLRRDLRFERLKLLSASSLAANLLSAILLSWFGLGAAALIISGNVVSALPMACSLFLVEGWRPRRWLFVPSVADREPVLQFARQQVTAGFLHSIRTAAESVVLARVFGITTLGLLNRALVLFQSTVGRISLVFLDTAYPILPLEQQDRARYAARAARFIEAALILVLPGATFLAIEGPHVSRVLYGGTWSDADAYLAPAAVALGATTVTTAASYVLLGIGLIRNAVTVEASVAVAGLAALLALPIVSGPEQYMWALAITQVLAATAAVVTAGPFIEPEWRRRGLWPATAASLGGSVGVIALRASMSLQGVPALAATVTVYTVIASGILALTAPSVVSEVLRSRGTSFWRRRVIVESEAGA
jgi:O-antigen/teichoic acid export membrane protein